MRKARVFLFITAGRSPRLRYENEANVMCHLALTPSPLPKMSAFLGVKKRLKLSSFLHLLHSWITFRRIAPYRGTIFFCVPEQRVCLIWSRQDSACWLCAGHWSDICRSTFSGGEVRHYEVVLRLQTSSSGCSPLSSSICNESDVLA